MCILYGLIRGLLLDLQGCTTENIKTQVTQIVYGLFLSRSTYSTQCSLTLHVTFTHWRQRLLCEVSSELTNPIKHTLTCGQQDQGTKL